MHSYFINIPRFIQRIFTRVLWSVDTDKKELYLTFDDGPTPEITSWVLAVLKEYNAKATFFCIGNNIAKYPQVFEAVLKEGHSVGNHTQNHLKGWVMDTEKYVEDFRKTDFLLGRYTLSNTKKYFRPPYGRIKGEQITQIKKQGYEVVLWSVLSADFDRSISPEKCLKNVISNAKKGAIIVFHDSQKASKNLKYALPKVLAHFSKKGYRFKALA